MVLLRRVPSHTVQAIALFAVAAFVAALMSSRSADEAVTRLLIEYPLLLIVAAIGILIINVIAALGGAAARGSALVAALLGGLLGWVVSGGGSISFAGLGYSELLQPAHAAAIALPWLFAATSPQTS